MGGVVSLAKHSGAEHFGLKLGLGPDQGRMAFRRASDTYLVKWTEWRNHDGRGLPSALIGQQIMLAGLAHDGVRALPERILTVTPAYAASEAAQVWDWSRGYGGVSGYRLRRAEPITISQDVIDALNDGHGYLVFGLDGVPE